MSKSDPAEQVDDGEWPAEYHQRIAECSNPERPYYDKEIMEFLYLDEQMSQLDMSKLFDCSSSSIGTWLRKHEIPVRSRTESMELAHGGGPYQVTYLTDKRGRETWKHDHNSIFVHRLAAVAKFGFEAVAENIVHHRNEVPWDNRPENFALMEHADHTSHHSSKLTWDERVEIERRYRTEDDASLRSLAPEYGVTSPTIWHSIRMVRERSEE